MIPNHAQFIAAIKDRKKVNVRYYSKPDSGVLDRVCAPIDYGPGGSVPDGLNRYWIWNYASDTDSHTLGLVPEQIVDLQVLGEGFDPTLFVFERSPTVAQPTPVSATRVVAADRDQAIPIL